MKYNESKPFLNGTEYKAFLYRWCMLCVHYRLHNDGLPESPANGGCPVLDAIKRARVDGNVFPCREIIEERDESGTYHKCTMFNRI